MLKIADLVQWREKDEWWLPNCPLVPFHWYRVTEVKNGPLGECIKINGWYVLKNFVWVAPGPGVWHVGDRVRIALEVMHEDGWENNWSREMSLHIGREYTVRHTRPSGVYFEEEHMFGWPPSCLEPA